jgi:hypothetical protein
MAIGFRLGFCLKKKSVYVKATGNRDKITSLFVLHFSAFATVEVEALASAQKVNIHLIMYYVYPYSSVAYLQ